MSVNQGSLNQSLIAYCLLLIHGVDSYVVTAWPIGSIGKVSNRVSRKLH